MLVMTPLLNGRLIDLLFPQPCLLCGTSLLLDRAAPPWNRLPLCQECLDKLRPIEGPRCRVCSQQLVSEVDLCLRCRSSEFPFASQWSPFAYGGDVRELIGQYKFRGQRALSALFAAQLAKTLADRFPALPIVPVPSRPRNVRKRGWDHVGLIAMKLQSGYGFDVRRLLTRSNGRSQKTLDFEHRLTNLRGKIHRAAGQDQRMPPRVVLLDDVFTTGATASECTRILLEHGVVEVRVVTLAVD